MQLESTVTMFPFCSTMLAGSIFPAAWNASLNFCSANLFMFRPKLSFWSTLILS
jgi:hypothetical protein